jgi:hypothetical protein
MTTQDTNAEALGLQALGWAVSDGDRAARLLALTGLSPEDLRDRLGEPALLAAVLGFLEAHEPDLVACAERWMSRPRSLWKRAGGWTHEPAAADHRLR